MKMHLLSAILALAVSSTAMVVNSKGYAQSPLVTPLITQQVRTGDRAFLQDVPAWVQAEAIDARSMAPPDMQVSRLIMFLRSTPARREAKLEFLRSKQTPQSKNFGKALTREQIGERFGANPRDIKAITAWLKSEGLSVDIVAKDRGSIVFSGSARDVGRAFNAQMYVIQDADGRKQPAATTRTSVPAALVPAISSVLGIYGAPAPAKKTIADIPVIWNHQNGWRVEASRDTIHPSFTEVDAGTTYHLVSPADFARIYNLEPLRGANYPGGPITGAGQRIAVLTGSDFNETDWSTFRSALGLSGYTQGSITHVHSPNCTNPGVSSVPGYEKETALDAEWASAVAPDAAIEVWACDQPYATLYALAIDDDPPAIATFSFMYCEANLDQSFADYFEQTLSALAARNVSVFVSSGDGGAAGCDPGWPTAIVGLSTNAVASTAYATAVGGTDFSDTFDGVGSTYWGATNATDGRSAISYIPEMTWNDSCATAMRHPTDPTPMDYCNSGTTLQVAAGTGGFSAWYTRPSWQTGVAGLGNAASSRLVPDVSLFAASGTKSKHALIFCMSDQLNNGHPCVYNQGLVALMNASGGTSYASPAMAGIQALINQRRGQPVGNLAPILYGLAAVEYGDGVAPPPATLAACNASLGSSVSSSCVFHDVTVGDTTVPCDAGTPNCYGSGANNIGLIKDFNGNAAYNAGQGWDYATGLGSVNVTNLVEAVYEVTTPSQ